MKTYITRQEVLGIFDRLERQIKYTKEQLIAAPDDSSLADLKLSEATAQDIQLELIRRTEFNMFDGTHIVDSLLQRRNLWKSVLLTRPGGTEISGLISLRDLSNNLWNADTLYILANDEHAAHKLAKLGEEWDADTVNIHDMESTGRALGSSYSEGILVTMWWD